MGYYILAVLIGIDVLANALLGGRQYQTISCRVGESIRDGGWASKVPWPQFVKAHCASAIFESVV